MSDRPVVVIGSLNLDRIFRLAELPQPGVTHTALGYEEGVGGKGGNQSGAAARMGAATHMVGCLGQDAAGDRIASALISAGVETSAIFRIPSEPSGNAAILLTPEGQNSILVVPGANHALSPEHLRAHSDLVTGAAMLLLQLETPLAVLAEALALAVPAGVPVMLDPAPAAPLPPELLRQLTWFTPNESEARFYLRATGASAAPAENPAGHAEALCRHFQGLGPRNVVLKLGSQGAAMLTANGSFVHLQAPQVDVVDTTGAGDTLNGALASELIRGSSAEDALRFAIVSASLSTTRPGALAALPERSQVEAWLARLA